MAKGVPKSDLDKSLMADSIMTIVSNITSCRYLLFVDIIDQYHRDAEMTNEAELLFHMIDTKNNISLSEFKVNTTISPLEIPDSNDEPLLLNFTNTSAAVQKAFQKGLKQIRRGVVKR